MELGRVIETAVLRLKKEVTEDQMWEQQKAVNEILDTATGCYGYASGFRVPEISTDSGQYSEFVILVAWDSLESHTSWAEKEKEKPDSPLNGYDKLVEKGEMWHVTLTYGYLSAAATAAME
jgi:heme-degrading monooxygenase HmoA